MKLTVLWKENMTAGGAPRALSDLVASNVAQGVIHKSGQAPAVAIEREELERLLAERPGGARSALQAVKESYAEIGLMREQGVTWAEIAELLGRNGVVGRDGRRFTASTVRAAFFLVGAEIRQGQLLEDTDGERIQFPETVDSPDPEPLQADGAFEAASNGGDAEKAQNVEPARSWVEETLTGPIVDFSPEESVPDDEIAPDWPGKGDSGDVGVVAEAPLDAGLATPAAVPVSFLAGQGRPASVRPRGDDMLLMMPVRGKAAAAALDEPAAPAPVRIGIALVEATAPPLVVPPEPLATVPAGVATTPVAGKRATHEAALKVDWTRRIDS